MNLSPHFLSITADLFYRGFEMRIGLCILSEITTQYCFTCFLQKSPSSRFNTSQIGGRRLRRSGRRCCLSTTGNGDGWSLVFRNSPPAYVKNLDTYTYAHQVTCSKDDRYSAYTKHVNMKSGHTFIHGKNICYNPRKQSYTFYLPSFSSVVNPYEAVFHYGWNIRISRDTVPTQKVYWVEEDSYITQPFTEHHIYHFVESLNFLWTKLMFMQSFPAVRLLLFSDG